MRTAHIPAFDRFWTASARTAVRGKNWITCNVDGGPPANAAEREESKMDARREQDAVGLFVLIAEVL